VAPNPFRGSMTFVIGKPWVIPRTTLTRHAFATTLPSPHPPRAPARSG
jgi:hypothetical protein